MWDQLQRALRIDHDDIGAPPSDNEGKRIDHDQSDCQNDSAERLLNLVQNELVPRLLMAHDSQAIDHVQRQPAHRDECGGDSTGKIPAECVLPSQLPHNDVSTAMRGSFCASDADIQRLALACVQGDIDYLLRRVEASVERGYSLEIVYLNLLAPTARYLGERWLDDSLCFVDVHLGLLCLHRVLNRYEEREEQPVRRTQQSILLSCVPGEQHTFGVSMLGEFFRRAGWQVSNRCGQTIDQMTRHINSEYFDCVGLSLSSEAQLPLLERCVGQLRQSSRNREVIVVVGGSCFVNESSIVCPAGVDLCVVDAAIAVDCVAEKVRGKRSSAGLARQLEIQEHDDS